MMTDLMHVVESTFHSGDGGQDMRQHIHIQAEFDVEFSGDAREHPALTAIVDAVMAQDNGGISASVTDIGGLSDSGAIGVDPYVPRISPRRAPIPPHKT